MLQHRITTALTLALTFMISGACTSLRAEVLFEEDFNYSGDVDSQELVGQNGGTGFGGTWLGNTAATQLTSDSLYAPVPGGLNISGGSGALQIGTGSSTAISSAIVSRALDASFSGDQVFVRFMIRGNAGSVEVADRVALWLESSTGPYMALLPLGGTNDDFYARPSAGTAPGTGGKDFVLDQTYLVVAQFSKSVSGASELYDSVAVWIDPAATDEATPDYTVGPETDGTFSISSFDAIGFQTNGVDNDDVYIIDNIKGGTTFNDVVAIPEPGSVALIGAGAALLATRRGNRGGTRC